MTRLQMPIKPLSQPLSQHLVEVLRVAEGFRERAYRCPGGYWTIGFGHRVADDFDRSTVWKVADATNVLRVDIRDAAFEAARNWLTVHGLLCRRPIPAWIEIVASEIGDARLGALVEMAFQLGGDGQRGFPLMWRAVRERDWSVAADEVLDSLWDEQTPRRTAHVAAQLEGGSLLPYE